MKNEIRNSTTTDDEKHLILPKEDFDFEIVR